ncbi:MAG TPA: YkvA family protein [Candidatus Acidoferrales bacterium]|nr:YkvA family protein [Candidatus Acidoferrales bacterium]
MSLRAGAPWPPLQLGARGLRLLRYLPQFVRLYWRLLWDRRVSIWPKALLLLSGLYVVSPVDLIPDVIPFFGELDDLVVVIAVCRLFIYLCPPAVVQEHVRRIGAGE